MPVITKEPQNVTVGQYDRAEFTVGLDTTTDATVYTWYVVVDGGSAPTKVQQSRNPKFVIAEASTGLHKYFCEIDVDGDGATVLTSRTCLLYVYLQVMDTTKLACSTDYDGPSSQNLELYSSLSPEQYPNLNYELVADYVHDPELAPDQIIGGGSASDLPVGGRFWEQVDAGSAVTLYASEDYVLGGGDAATTFDFAPIPVRAANPGGEFVIREVASASLTRGARFAPDANEPSSFCVEQTTKSALYSMPPRDEFDENMVIWEAELVATSEEEA